MHPCPAAQATHTPARPARASKPAARPAPRTKRAKPAPAYSGPYALHDLGFGVHHGPFSWWRQPGFMRHFWTVCLNDQFAYTLPCDHGIYSAVTDNFGNLVAVPR